MADVDPVIRRIERTALVWCGGTTAAALISRPDLPSLAAGIVGGGLLVFVSLFAIRGSVDAALDAAGLAPATGRGASPPAGDDGGEAAADGRRRLGTGTLLKLTGRFGLLALAAYVMIARLRLHPVGLLIGASSLVAGASLEAVRTLRRH